MYDGFPDFIQKWPEVEFISVPTTLNCLFTFCCLFSPAWLLYTLLPLWVTSTLLLIYFTVVAIQMRQRFVVRRRFISRLVETRRPSWNCFCGMEPLLTPQLRSVMAINIHWHQLLLLSTSKSSHCHWGSLAVVGCQVKSKSVLSAIAVPTNVISFRRGASSGEQINL